MKKFINNPKKIKTEMLEGLALAGGGIVTVTESGLVISKALQHADRVTVIGLSTIGNEPFSSGFAGEGLLDIAVTGGLFAGPGPSACAEAIQLADKGRGVLLIAGNHTGDNLTCSIALKEAQRLGVRAELVTVCDDACDPGAQKENCRGLLGCLPVYKAAAAAAAAGKSLEETAAASAKAAANTASVTVTASGGTDPASGRALTAAGERTVKFGTGLSGEGGRDMAYTAADETAAAMLDALIARLGLQEGERVLLLVSGSGATGLMEQLIFYRSCCLYLAGRGIEVAAGTAGELLTVQEEAGISVCLCRADEEMTAAWQAPCRAVFYKN